jgi:hypothetical protein
MAKSRTSMAPVNSSKPMNSEKTLVQSSITTRAWVHRLRDELPQLESREKMYWAAFSAAPHGSTVAYLNPSQKAIRLFLALDPDGQPDLQPTPSTSSWARFPSVLRIASVRDLIRARRLILKSHAAIGRRLG